MKQIILNGKQYNDVMKALKPVVAKEYHRPALTGVVLEVEENTARFTALNGYALTHFVLPHSGDKAEEPWSVIMPLMPVKATGNALIVITADDYEITVKNAFSGEALTQKIIEDEFPAYRKVIPAPVNEKCVYLSAKLLKNVLEGAELCDQALIKLSLDLNSPCAPIVLKGTCGDSQYYTGLVMPVKAKEEYKSHVI